MKFPRLLFVVLFRLQMVALKVKKKGTSKVDYCQIAETPTAEAGPKHQRALLDSISGDIFQSV